MRRIRIAGGLVALALALTAAVAPSATATSGPAPDKADKAATAATGERHCAGEVTTGVTECFDTFRESIEHATAGRVTDARLSATTGTVDGSTTAKLNGGPSTAAEFVIGIQYYWQDYNRHPDGTLHTPAYTLTHSGPVTCTSPTSDVDYRSAPLLNDTGHTVDWNNNIRSFQSGFNNCLQRMWDFSNCTGPLIGYSAASPDLIGGRDRAECVEWS